MTCQVVDMTINNECHVRVELDYFSRVLSYILQGAVCRGFLVLVTYRNKDRTYPYDVGNISSAKFIITYTYDFLRSPYDSRTMLGVRTILKNL